MNMARSGAAPDWRYSDGTSDRSCVPTEAFRLRMLHGAAAKESTRISTGLRGREFSGR